MKSILDSSFKYIPAAQTDVAKTFARVRKQFAAQQVAKGNANAEASVLGNPDPRPAVAAIQFRMKA